MQIVVVILVIILLLILVLLLLSSIKRIIELKKNTKSGKAIDMTVLEGVPGSWQGEVVVISLDDENQEVIIKGRVSNSENGRIKYSQIDNLGSFTETEIINAEPVVEDKSVIKRAIVGGVFLGGIGAIVGGMSGIGTKTVDKSKTVFQRYFVLNYKDEKEHEKVMSFGIVGATWGLEKFESNLKQRIDKN